MKYEIIIKSASMLCKQEINFPPNCWITVIVGEGLLKLSPFQKIKRFFKKLFKVTLVIELKKGEKVQGILNILNRLKED